MMLVLVTLLSTIAVGRIMATYSEKAQGFDEPCHVAAGMEFLDRGTYLLDPVHPPLSRIAIALPLYLAGERFPSVGKDKASNNYNSIGNAILQNSGHYRRNLALSRLGVLPFFLLAIAVVFYWTRQQFGEFAALMAVALLTTTPTVLAFSALAYSDIVAAATQLTALFVFSRWIDRPTLRWSLALGIALGLALLSKATTVMFFPVCALGVVLTKWCLTRDQENGRTPSHWWRQGALILVIVCATVWAGYRFSMEHVREATGLSVESMPSFQHFPGPLRGWARSLVLSDPVVPAPALFKGVATAWVLNQTAPGAYLLGKIRPGGWWYFFLVGVAVKAPLPLLALLACGLVSLRCDLKERRWANLVPAVCVLAILVVTMPVKYNAGVRHVLVVFPLIAIVAAGGCAWLWQRPGRHRLWARTALILLLAWQMVSTARAQRDFIAYFNELAGKDPSKVLVAGCDLDCGQDVFRLADDLRQRHVSHLNLAIWTSADMSRMGFPAFDVPEPNTPVTGWFAISLRALRFGDLFHDSYPPNSFDWLSPYKPTAKVGSTILLYYIPAGGVPGVHPATHGSEPQSP